jgi:serine/threonine kinase PknH
VSELAYIASILKVIGEDGSAGTTFGRYRLLRPLGQGGMGEVWRAHDTDTDRIVAIKLLAPHLSEDQEFQRRFRREAHAAAQLNDPHVIPIHNVDMRLIEGQDLGTLLTDGPLNPARAVRIIEQVASALHAAHEAGLLHRDIKPSNILIGRNDFAYLIDFGIARVVSETRMTQSGFMLGTFQYIAPERLDNQTQEDARVDIYSLACVLYEALTGNPPFAGTTPAHLLAAHLNAPPPRPSTTQPNMSAAVDDVIATGMAKDPGQRYATTIELAEAARNAINTPPARSSQPTVLADAMPPPPLPPRQPAEPIRHIAEWGQQHAGPPPFPIAPQRKRNPGLVLGIVGLVVVAALVSLGVYFAIKKFNKPTATGNTTTSASADSAGPPPVEASSLDSLLLSADEINTAMGATGMAVNATANELQDDSDHVADRSCLEVEAPAQISAYAGKGWKGVRGQNLQEPDTPSEHLVGQVVVSFSSAQDAEAFYAASAASWPKCSNRDFIYTANEAGQRDADNLVGPISNTNGTLSATLTKVGSAWVCQRALTVANNVAVDVTACGFKQSDSAVDIAHQIAGKVPT